MNVPLPVCDTGPRSYTREAICENETVVFDSKVNVLFSKQGSFVPTRETQADSK